MTNTGTRYDPEPVQFSCRLHSLFVQDPCYPGSWLKLWRECRPVQRPFQANPGTVSNNRRRSSPSISFPICILIIILSFDNLCWTSEDIIKEPRNETRTWGPSYYHSTISFSVFQVDLSKRFSNQSSVRIFYVLVQSTYPVHHELFDFTILA